MNDQYIRVLPRDLFNEGKLLKCIGKISLHIHDANKTLRGLKFEHDGSFFMVCQSEQDGSLSLANITFKLGDKELYLYTKYNSREDWPLFASFNEDNTDEVNVFDLFGNFHDDFLTLIENV